MINISFNGYDLQSSTVITSELQHENLSQKRLNIQKFSTMEGGRLIQPDFDIKIITLKGIIKGTSQANLEGLIDTFKKNINYTEKNLDIEYSGGTRRYIATCSKMLFDRKFYTVDMIDFELEFTISNPPFGTNIDTTTIEDLANTHSSVTTTTGTIDGTPDFAGTFRPNPIIKITLNTCNGIRKIYFCNTDEDEVLTNCYIENYKFYDGDIILINTTEGTVTVNGINIDFSGFPKFSLLDNRYELKITGNSYNVDLKFIYYPLWL